MSNRTSPVQNSKGKPGGSSHSWEEWTQQLQAYVAWVNSQLKKKPGCHMVEDLRRDMQDGVALVHLVEIVSGESLARADYTPQTSTAMKENVERVLQFMTTKRIRMHHTSAKDIVDGNLKAIMRLILSLAAHYKPSSVKQAPSTPTSGATTPNISGTPASVKGGQRSQPSFAAMAANAAAAIHDARKEAAGVGSPIHRYRDHSSIDSDGTSGKGHGTSSSPRVNHDTPGRTVSPRPGRLINQTSDSDQGSAGEEATSKPGSRKNSLVWTETLLEEQEVMSSNILDSKNLLLQLQELLLSGRYPDEDGNSEAEEDQVPFEGSTPKEQVIVLRSRLDQQREECNQLKTELSKTKQECRDLQGTKAGLQSRLTEQDNALLQMKAEILRMGFTTQNLEAECNELKRKLEERDHKYSETEWLVKQKDELLQQQQEQMEALTQQLQDLNSFKTELQNQLEQSNGGTSLQLDSKIQNLSQRLERVNYAESNLAGNLSAHEKKMEQFETQMHQHENNSAKDGEEIQVIRSMLRTLRSNLSSQDPSHHSLDILEQSISSLLQEQAPSKPPPRGPDNSLSRFNSGVGLPSRSPVPSDMRRSPMVTSMARTRSPMQSKDMQSQPQTKVLYFTERTVTPFMTSIPRRLGEVTLRDFKSIFDKEGEYRYHFKALDPEFGTVKEEVVDDDDILPGWEGKIVGWVEEDNG
ncbi:dixin-like isoform X2 [Apostichopus japonicus]|uniref:dixin-like isoform X2 n=1 Tax=Stichopus japonicus TaxID=307972 RepID=UPI003AB8ECAF